MIILAGIEVGERLPIGVDDLEATGQALNGPWKRRLAIGSKPREKGADRSRRPLDNERPTTTYLSVAALPPAVTGSPVEPEKSRAARAGLLHVPNVAPDFVEKKFRNSRSDGGLNYCRQPRLETIPVTSLDAGSR